jgi:hypothetical protein
LLHEEVSGEVYTDKEKIKKERMQVRDEKHNTLDNRP